MKKHLISMTQRTSTLKEQFERCVNQEMPTGDLFNLRSEILTNLFKLSSFLSKTLEIWQFVPCKLVDGVWVVLEEPTHKSVSKMPLTSEGWDAKYWRLKQEYQEAKDRCYFEGFEFKYSDSFVNTVSNGRLWFNFKNRNIFVNDKVVSTIEDLVNYNLELTPTGQKESGLI